MTNREEYRFTVTIHSDDLAVIYCLRALADYSQKTGNTRIVWGGTTKGDWASNGNRVTFRFTKSEYRASLLSEARRLLGEESWTVID